MTSAPTNPNPGLYGTLTGYDPAGHQINIALQTGTVVQDATTGWWYAPLQINGSISATNPSVSTTGAAVPTSATYIGANNGGNIVGLLTDASGFLKVNVAAGGGSGGTSSSYGAAFPATGTAVGGTDGTNMRGFYVTQQHNADNQTPPASGYGMLVNTNTGVLNPAGTVDRMRGTGQDNAPLVGIPAGAQQLIGPASTTTFAGAGVTGSANAQSVQVASSTSIKVGDIILTQDNPEYVEITAKADSTHVTGVFLNNHASGQTLTWYRANMARDATIGDNVAGTGVSPSATYLYNQVSGNFEFDRSANGEKDGASGQGTAVAAEYEWNGNVPANGGTLSGLQFDRARNLQGKGLGSGTLSDNPLAANSTTLHLNSAPTTLDKGMLLVLDRAGASPEINYVGTSYTFGSTTVPLQIATVNAHNQNTTVEWDQSAALGPGLNGFLPSGLGIEEEAIYNSVDGKMYIQRSATADGMAGANLPAEGLSVYNGSTWDRLKGDNTGAARVSLYVKTSAAADTVLTVGSATSANSLPTVIASDQAAVPVKRSTVAVYSLASTTTSGTTQNSGDLTVGPYTEIGLDINTTAQAGTSPTIQYFYERKGADGIYYVLWQSAVLTVAANTLSTSIGAGMAYNQSLGSTGRLRWVVGGSATPTFTHSLNIYGK